MTIPSGRVISVVSENYHPSHGVISIEKKWSSVGNYFPPAVASAPADGTEYAAAENFNLSINFEITFYKS